MGVVQTAAYWINNLVTIVTFIIGTAIGFFTPFFTQLYKRRRARKFWRPFADAKQSHVVVGMHRLLLGVDPAGLMGAGCVKALIDLQGTFGEAHLGRLPSIVSSEPTSD